MAGESFTDEQLIEAAQSEDPARLRRLLESGGDPNAKWEDMPALTLAAMKGLPAHVGLLLSAGANVDAIDALGLPALAYTAIGRWPGHVEVAQRLIAAGADVSVALPGGKRLADLAVEAGNRDVLEILLSAGATISPRMQRFAAALRDERSR